MNIDPIIEDLASQLAAKMAQSLDTILGKELADELARPPEQKPLFRLPPEGVWVYRVEYRVRLMTGDWSPWYNLSASGLVKVWYSREADALRALARYQERRGWLGREYRIEPHWSEKFPWRRDRDRVKNLNKRPAL